MGAKLNIGFIGAGNMGGAIIRGYAEARRSENSCMRPTDIYVYNPSTEKVDRIIGDYPEVSKSESLSALAEASDILMVCVKPQIIDDVFESLADTDLTEKTIISIAAGISIGYIKKALGPGTKVVRAMPNTPAMAGEGMTALAAEIDVTSTGLFMAHQIFSSFGQAIWVDESLMDIVTGVSGSSPAYAYMYIQGLIDAGIKGGLAKEAATIMAAQATLGAAKMVLAGLDSGTSPEQLRINVCSPGGTTIEGVNLLSDAGFTELVEKAAEASAAKSRSVKNLSHAAGGNSIIFASC
ncbi:MAG: pyrroline-5-carboxylate reductase [Clostridiales Family XIII bacterium]|jgi:pyrroline-5-carboxylate reductase|nr:pyrroline-5-carboxylate reductase [Clostridiales Family XIII bacterium]